MPGLLFFGHHTQVAKHYCNQAHEYHEDQEGDFLAEMAEPVNFDQDKTMNETNQFGCKRMTETVIGEQVMNMGFISHKRWLAIPDPGSKDPYSIKYRDQYNAQYEYRYMRQYGVKRCDIDLQEPDR